MEEERRFTVLLERVEQHYQVLSEKVSGLDQKVDRGLQDDRRDMDTGFRDLHRGIATLVRDVKDCNRIGDCFNGMPPRSTGRRKACSLASDEPTEAPSTQFVKDAAPLWGAEDVTT